MNSIAKFLGLSEAHIVPKFKCLESVTFDSYTRSLIEYSSGENDQISVLLFEPKSEVSNSSPGVLIHHQHNGEQFLGKSEVAGIKGDPLQAFGPALAQMGFVVLAPDQICFEDRRRNKIGTEPSKGDEDFLQQFNELSYRLTMGDTLMRKVLDDAAVGFSLLLNHRLVNPERAGVMGHSLGGNTTLFQAATDERVRFACSSGALCSYKNKIENETSFEMGLIIPGFLKNFEFTNLVQSILPRDLMVVSAEKDRYSKDANIILEDFQEVKHIRYSGGHALDEQRHKAILDWLATH